MAAGQGLAPSPSHCDCIPDAPQAGVCRPGFLVIRDLCGEKGSENYASVDQGRDKALPGPAGH